MILLLAPEHERLEILNKTTCVSDCNVFFLPMKIVLYAADYAVLCSDHEIPNICDMIENVCENGHCIRMGSNDYRCECNRGFQVSEDQRSCIGKWYDIKKRLVDMIFLVGYFLLF